jgi:hypothetical protein
MIKETKSSISIRKQTKKKKKDKKYLRGKHSLTMRTTGQECGEDERREEVIKQN